MLPAAAKAHCFASARVYTCLAYSHDGCFIESTWHSNRPMEYMCLSSTMPSLPVSQHHVPPPPSANDSPAPSAPRYSTTAVAPPAARRPRRPPRWWPHSAARVPDRQGQGAVPLAVVSNSGSDGGAVRLAVRLPCARVSSALWGRISHGTGGPRQMRSPQ